MQTARLNTTMTFDRHWFTQAMATAISPYGGRSRRDIDEASVPDIDGGSELDELDFDFVNDYDVTGFSGTITLRYGGDVCFEHHLTFHAC